ncbi:hypothetical protein NL676_038541 [Syzygium grande]|nr:hypothetical protein NL676_038541 [Syzygium grande]
MDFFSLSVKYPHASIIVANRMLFKWNWIREPRRDSWKALLFRGYQSLQVWRCRNEASRRSSLSSHHGLSSSKLGLSDLDLRGSRVVAIRHGQASMLTAAMTALVQSLACGLKVELRILQQPWPLELEAWLEDLTSIFEACRWSGKCRQEPLEVYVAVGNEARVSEEQEHDEYYFTKLWRRR